MMYRFQNIKHKKILQGSILLSICLHVAGLAFLQRQSLWFSSTKVLESPSAPWVASMEKEERDHILKEAFQPVTFEEAGEKIKPRSEVLAQSHLKAISSLPIEGKFEELLSLLPKTPFPANELIASNQSLEFPLPPEKRLNLFENLPKDLIVLSPSPPTPLSPLLPPPPLAMHTTLESTSSPPFPQAPPSEVVHSDPLIRTPPWTELEALAKAPSFIPPTKLPKLPSLDELQTTSYSDFFDIELTFLPKDEGGYIFALTLIPRPDLHLLPIQQNYLFLIDRSNSIQRDRLASTKNAVRKALDELNEEDTFNIIVFDNKIEKLSPYSLSFSEKSIARAKNFLDNIELGSIFSQADLYKPLFLTIPTNVNENELYTAILMTDGEYLSKRGAAHSLLYDWTQYNEGRVALYVIGMGEDLNLSTLDATSALNKGKVITSPTRRGLKRKLMKLMKTIRNPVAKNLSCKAISRAPQGLVEIFPKDRQAPNLFLNEPYTLIGDTDSMDDLILFVQGRLNGEWLHIKKTLSFLNAKKGGSSLKAQWALRKAYELYDQYLLDEDPQQIAEARSLLEAHNLQIVFE